MLDIKDLFVINPFLMTLIIVGLLFLAFVAFVVIAPIFGGLVAVLAELIQDKFLNNQTSKNIDTGKIFDLSAGSFLIVTMLAFVFFGFQSIEYTYNYPYNNLDPVKTKTYDLKDNKISSYLHIGEYDTEIMLKDEDVGKEKALDLDVVQLEVKDKNGDYLDPELIFKLWPKLGSLSTDPREEKSIPILEMQSKTYKLPNDDKFFMVKRNKVKVWAIQLDASTKELEAIVNNTSENIEKFMEE